MEYAFRESARCVTSCLKICLVLRALYISGSVYMYVFMCSSCRVFVDVIYFLVDANCSV